MKQQTKTNPQFIHLNYFILAVGLSCGSAAYLIFRGQPLLQTIAVLGTGIFYILWGIIDHAREGDIHVKIVLEYVLISFLAMALLLTLIFRT